MGVPILRPRSSNGRVSAFQADDVGSIPITRSRRILSRAIAGKREVELVFDTRFVGPRSSGVEHFLGKEEVTGSNPVVGSRYCWALLALKVAMA